MSLDWSISDCDNWEEIALNQDVEGPITDAIIWGSMITKLGEITEDNWAEWYARYVIWNRVLCFDNDLEAKDFHRRIGMSTNVFPAESRSKWLNGVIKKQLMKAEATAKYEIKVLLEEEKANA
jgi:hypothetical protein